MDARRVLVPGTKSGTSWAVRRSEHGNARGLGAWGFAVLAVTCLLSGCPGGAPPQGDAGRGEILHEACLGCHGTDLYTAPDRKVRSLDELNKELDRWNDHYNPKFTEKEMADLLAYVNERYYKF